MSLAVVPLKRRRRRRMIPGSRVGVIANVPAPNVPAYVGGVQKAPPDPLDVAGPTALRRAATAVLSALRALPRAVSAQDVDFALAHGQPGHATFGVERSEVATAMSDLSIALEAAAMAAARQEAKRIPEQKAKTAFDFRLVNPRVVEFADSRSADLVVEITDATRESLRGLVRGAVSATEGLASPRSLAAAVRSKVGLHSRWARAVLNYQFNLEASGSSAVRVAELTSKYYDKLLRTRATTIARTEIMRASNAGKIATWREMATTGWLGTATPMKEWVAADDAEPICADLDGTQIGIDETWDADGEDVDMPPAHPNCRCTAILIRKGAA